MIMIIVLVDRHVPSLEIIIMTMTMIIIIILVDRHVPSQTTCPPAGTCSLKAEAR